MKAIVKLTDYITLEIEEKDEMETLEKAIVLSSPPLNCSICKSDVITFSANKDTEGNTYVNVKCTCGAKAKLGQYKAGGYFWHNEFKKFERKEK